MIVGLDVDNVLYPFSSVYTRYVERTTRRVPGSLNDEAKSWTWYKDEWGFSTEAFLLHFTRGVKDGVIFTEGDPLPGSLYAANWLVEHGHTIEYITDRTPPGVTEGVAWMKTSQWLSGHGFPSPHSVTISADKYKVKTDVFLDDGPHNIVALKASGHPCPVVWDRPHNQDVGGLRVYTWAEFLDLVEWKSQQQEAAA